MAIALRVFVPQGYMVAPGPHFGAPQIVPCTDGAPAAHSEEGSHAHGANAPSDHPSSQKTDHPCVFAGFAAMAAPEPPMLAGMADWRRVAPASGLDPQRAPGRGLAAPPPPSTGPPQTI